MIAGVPFNKVHVLDMVPGELRLDVTPESIWKLYNERKDSEEYLNMVADGKEKLATLRQKQKDGTLQDYINLKDSKEEEGRQELDRQLKEKKLAEEALASEKRLLEEARSAEKRKQDEAKAQAAAEAKQKMEEDRKRVAEERKEKERQKQQELAAMARRQAAERKSSSSVSSSSSKSKKDGDDGTAGVGVLGLGALAAGFVSSAPEANMTATTATTTEKSQIPSVESNATSIMVNTTTSTSASTIMANTTSMLAATTMVNATRTISTNLKDLESEEVDESDDDIIASLAAPVDMNPNTIMEGADDANDVVSDALATLMDNDQDESATSPSKKDTTVPVNDGPLQNLVANVKTKEKDFDRKMETAEKRYKDALVEAAEVKAAKNKSETQDTISEEVKDPYMPDYEDDGANDWLRVLSEIRDADEVEDDDDGVMGEFSFSHDEEDELVLVNDNQREELDDAGPTKSTLSKDI
ncbi:MAG: hypothetical protein SGARI_002651 [Bacillariaceae sp.]